MCSFTTRRAYNFSNINSARVFCQKHRSVYVEIVIRLLTVINVINIKAGFFHRDVMPKGVFSIFKKDPLLIYDLVIFITVENLIILLLLNNFGQTSDQTSKHCYLFSIVLTGHHF